MTMTNPMTELQARLKATWMTGDYDRFSRYMEPGAREFFERLNLPAGSKLLDAGCGAGQLALIAARAGLQVTGCDIATNWIERARARAAAEGLAATFVEGDVQDLPCSNGQFDAVVSVVGAMFAPQPERAASEMLRVCRPGGMIAMVNWTASGFIGQMLKVIARHIAPPGMPSPLLWGDPAIVRERLGHGAAAMRLTPRMYRFDYPFGPAAVVEFFRENYGPMTRAFAALDTADQSRLRAELVDLWFNANQAAGGRTVVDAEYLEVIMEVA